MSKSEIIQLADFTKKIESLPVTQLYKLDSILSDIANCAYEIGEYISELDKGLKDFNSKQNGKNLAEMILLEKQIDSLFKLLYKMEYDGHYMDRVQHTLSYVNDDLKKLIVELGRVK